MDSLKIYRITEKYVRFLNTVDSRVQYNRARAVHTLVSY